MKRTRTYLTNLGHKLVLASLVAASLPIASYAAPPAQGQPGGKIAFIRSVSGEPANIYVVNTDGSGLTQLTKEQTSSYAPAWSPDGNKIVFIRGGASFSSPVQIVTMNADGTGQTRLTNNQFSNFPAWSPDGTRIAYNRNASENPTEAGRTYIYAMNADGTSEKQLSTGGYEEAPAWSPDGKKIAMVCGSPGGSRGNDICVINADGTGQVRYPQVGDDRFPTWSPDGKKIAFSKQGQEFGLFVINSDGTGQTPIVKRAGAIPNRPSWSPDGGKITYDDLMDDSINIVNADGTGSPVRFTPDGNTPAWQPSKGSAPQPTAIVGTTTPLPPPVALPGTGTQTFPETKKTVTGLFLDYWKGNGALAQQGFPISDVMGEKSDLNGQVYTVQYFERAVFEYHPEITDPKFKVLLSQLGTFQYKKKYGTQGAPAQTPDNSAGSRLFPETGKRIGGRFLEYWTKNGGLAQQGLPLSDPFMEKSETDGKTYMVQYFERAVFEMHPENQRPNDVLLSLLGVFQYKQKYQGGGNTQPTPVAQPTTAPVPPTAAPTTPPAQPTVAANPCSNVPASSNMQITPSNCAKAGTRFVFIGSGFNPGEKVGVYATRPDQSVNGAPFQVDADESGVTSGDNAVILTTTASAQQGVWAFTMEGVTSHKKAIGYIRVLAP